jgi:menaquinone-dependent protoporphyrinogen oxidase
MRVLVSAASRHGSTTEIAARIAEILGRSQQIAVVEAAPADVDSLDGFDAYVIGSAVYMGRWLTDARELIHRLSGWTDHPVWLFSSGPIGDPRSRPNRPST